MARYEFRSRIVTTGDREGWGKPDAIERACNEWAKEGFIVFSVVCPDSSNYSTFRLTAKRDIEIGHTPEMFEDKS